MAHTHPPTHPPKAACPSLLLQSPRHRTFPNPSTTPWGEQGDHMHFNAPFQVPYTAGTLSSSGVPCGAPLPPPHRPRHLPPRRSCSMHSPTVRPGGSTRAPIAAEGPPRVGGAPGPAARSARPLVPPPSAQGRARALGALRGRASPCARARALGCKARPLWFLPEEGTHCSTLQRGLHA